METLVQFNERLLFDAVMEAAYTGGPNPIDSIVNDAAARSKGFLHMQFSPDNPNVIQLPPYYNQEIFDAVACSKTLLESEYVRGVEIILESLSEIEVRALISAGAQPFVESTIIGVWDHEGILRRDVYSKQAIAELDKRISAVMGTMRPNVMGWMIYNHSGLEFSINLYFGSDSIYLTGPCDNDKLLALMDVVGYKPNSFKLNIGTFSH